MFRRETLGDADDESDLIKMQVGGRHGGTHGVRVRSSLITTSHHDHYLPLMIVKEEFLARKGTSSAKVQRVKPTVDGAIYAIWMGGAVSCPCSNVFLQFFDNRQQFDFKPFV